MNIIEMIAQDVFDKVRSRFSNLEMGDGEGNTTNNPKEARFFDFDFAIEGNTLGRVSVSINDIGTLKVYYGQGITEGTDSVIRGVWYDFLKEMRMFAMRRMLRFDTRDINKGNLNKNDFQYLATNGPKESNMTESQYFGSSKTSYRALENTKLIIKHSQAVNETQPGARSRHISALFIENADGERFKYPFNHLSGAKAMQRHVANGGRPYDDKGTAIIDISESIIQLNLFKRQAGREGFVNESTQDIFERAMAKLEQLRHDCTSLSKQTYYENWSNNFKANTRAELDEITLEDYKDKFTVHQFEDNLTSIFPLLHAIMQETSEVDLADVIEGSEEKCNECGMWESKCSCDDVEEAYNPNSAGATHARELKAHHRKDLETKAKGGDETAKKRLQSLNDKEERMRNDYDARMERESVGFENFENWADAIVEGSLEPDTIMALKDLLDNGLTLGADATSAVEALESIGINDEDLNAALESLAKINPEADPRETIIAWVAHTDPESAQELGAEPAAEPAPVEPAPVEPAPEADPAAMAPAPAEDPNAVAPAPVAEDEDSMDNEEPVPQRGNMREIAEVVKSFYDRETGRFPKGETGVIVHCKKMFGDQGGQLAERLVAHLSQRSHQQMAYEDMTRILKLSGVNEGAKWRNPKYKDKLYHQGRDPEPGHFHNPAPAKVPMGGVTQGRYFNMDDPGDPLGKRTANTDGRYGDITVSSKGKRKGMLTKNTIADLKGDIKKSIGKHRHPNLPEETDNEEQMAYEDMTRILKLSGVKEGVEKSQIPAFKRKEKGGDWKMSTKDLEDEKTKSPTSSAGLARKKKEIGVQEVSHQTKTTMKHADNPTDQQRAAAKGIKPGIPGFPDRIAMLKDLERTGKLKTK